MNKEVYIISAVRTPIGSFGGALKDFSATELGGFAVKSRVKKSGTGSEIGAGCPDGLCDSGKSGSGTGQAGSQICRPAQ